MFSGLDILILIVIAISVGIAAIRGFFKEAVSLITWLAAILITLMFTTRFSSLLPQSIQSAEARYVISSLVLFFGTMVVGGLINFLFQQMLSSTGKAKVDLWLGVVFGAARGVVIVIVLVLLANLNSAFKQETWWRESALIPPMQRAAQFIHTQLPQELAQHFVFS